MRMVNEPPRARHSTSGPLEPSRASPPRRPGVGAKAKPSRLRRLAGGTLWVLIAIWVVTTPAPRSLPAEERKPGADGAGVLVEWHTLGGLDLRTGEAEPELAALDGKLVRVPGYVVPLEEDLREFLLVPYVGACIHVPPPPPNQMVYVRMPPDVEVEVDPWGWDPIYAVGTLEIANFDSPYGAVGFRMTGLRTEPYFWEER